MNHEASLYKLKQITTVTAFLHEFEYLPTQVTGLSQRSLLNCFLSDLKEEIQRELYILKPTDLHNAVGMAKLVEDKYIVARSAVSHPFVPQLSAPAPTQAIQRSVQLPIKCLSPAKMAARREKSLCFNCDSKFIPGHKCNPAMFLCLMEESEDSSSPEDAPLLDM